MGGGFECGDWGSELRWVYGPHVKIAEIKKLP